MWEKKKLNCPEDVPRQDSWQGHTSRTSSPRASPTVALLLFILGSFIADASLARSIVLICRHLYVIYVAVALASESGGAFFFSVEIGPTIHS